MSDDEIITLLKQGETLNFGCNGRNTEIMDLMHRLEKKGLIETKDMGLEQETRRTAVWIGPKEAPSNDQ